MKGFITAADLDQADKVFPGIAAFFDGLVEKPRTFLELLSAFERWVATSEDRASDSAGDTSTADSARPGPSAKICNTAE